MCWREVLQEGITRDSELGSSTWYSLLGAGSDDSPLRSSPRTMACRACRAPRNIMSSACTAACIALHSSQGLTELWRSQTTVLQPVPQPPAI